MYQNSGSELLNIEEMDSGNILIRSPEGTEFLLTNFMKTQWK